MKKYNSVFTLAFEAEHDKQDALDLTYEDLRNALQDRLDRMDSLNLSLISRGAFDGPDDTIKNHKYEQPQATNGGGPRGDLP
jgi:hypothetical protein